MSSPKKISRRAMLGGAASIAVTAPIAAIAKSTNSADKPTVTNKYDVLPRRKLGRNGPEVTMLAMGGQAELITPDYYDKAWDMGIRYFDMADCYRNGQTEREMAKWLAKYPERRKESFIVTKDHPKQISDLPAMLDKRLEVLGTDYLDMFLIHGLGAKEYGEQSYDWPKSKEFRIIAEKMKASGKTKMVGFSCHDLQSQRYLHAAAEGGFIDAILLHSRPLHQDGDGMDRALDACHKAGIGLVGMKVIRNGTNIPKRVPEFDKLGITTHQAAIQAVLSDERFSATCVWLATEDQMRENTQAVRLYKKPLIAEHRQLIHDIMVEHGPAICPGCPSCIAVAQKHKADLHSISRYVAYYEQDGNMDAKKYYQALHPDERKVDNIDLASMQQNCFYHVNYPKIVERASYYFA